jgi:hypothetical protein
VQWWLFAAAVPVGWVVLVRRERRDRLAEGATEDTSGDAPGPVEPTEPVPEADPVPGSAPTSASTPAGGSTPAN